MLLAARESAVREYCPSILHGKMVRHMDLETFGISVITDMGNEESIETITHAEVLEAAKNAEPNVKKLICELILNY